MWDNMSNWKYEISFIAVPFVTKLVMLITYCKKLPPLKSHYPVIMWSFDSTLIPFLGLKHKRQSCIWFLVNIENEILNPKSWWKNKCFWGSNCEYEELISNQYFRWLTHLTHNIYFANHVYWHKSKNYRSSC